MRQILCLLSASLMWAGDGRVPRSSSSDYPAHQDTKNATIAAVRVTPEQLNRIFPSELSKRYIVLEVAIYPKNDAVLETPPMDFVLRLTDSESHPETAEEVAAMWRPHNNAHPDITSKTHVDTETGVIIGHGTDPVTGRPTTNAGGYERVGVSNRDNRPNVPYPSSGGVDADRFEAMLSKWALPEGRTASPVAGYLYFLVPKSTKAKAKAFELQYAHEGATATLTIPVATK